MLNSTCHRAKLWSQALTRHGSGAAKRRTCIPEIELDRKAAGQFAGRADAQAFIQFGDANVGAAGVEKQLAERGSQI